MAFKNGDRVRHIAHLTEGTVVNATVKTASSHSYGGGRITKVQWDGDGGEKAVSDPQIRLLELIEPPLERVRGVENIRPGLYQTHWHSGGKEAFFVVDPEVTKRYSNILSVEAYDIEGRPITIYLGDRGIMPWHTDTRTCDMGHVHSDAVYSETYTVRLDTKSLGC